MKIVSNDTLEYGLTKILKARFPQSTILAVKGYTLVKLDYDGM